MKLPKSKTGGIVVQNLHDETLIYNLSTNQAFCLNETSAKVFNACDGFTTFEELKSRHQLTDDVIYFALDGLKKENLLEDDYVSPFGEMNRRQVIRQVGLAGVIALPLISSIVAPAAAHAASICPNRVVSNVPNGCPIVGRIGGAGTCGDPATTSNYNTQCQNFYGASRCSSGKAIYSSCSPQQVQGFVQVTCECSA